MGRWKEKLRKMGGTFRQGLSRAEAFICRGQARLADTLQTAGETWYQPRRARLLGWFSYKKEVWLHRTEQGRVRWAQRRAKWMQTWSARTAAVREKVLQWCRTADRGYDRLAWRVRCWAEKTSGRVKAWWRALKVTSPVWQTVLLFLFWTAALALWEQVIHVTVFGSATWRSLLSFGVAAFVGAVLTLLSNLLSRGNRKVQYILMALIFLIYAVQLVYFEVSNTLLSLAYVAIGGDAIGGFLPMVLKGIDHALPGLLVMSIPFFVLAFLHRREFVSRDRRKLKLQGGVVVAAGVMLALSAALVRLPGGAWAVYSDRNATVDRLAEYFGVLTTEWLDFGHMTGQESLGELEVSDLSGLGSNKAPEVDPDAEQAGDEPAEEPVERNIMAELDFEKLNTLTEDKNLLALNNYFSNLTGTAKNDYTGYFAGCNLIHICAESFSPYLVDPVRTPTLYRLTNEGIVFKNFYNSFPSVTTNGEYSLCMGLMPDFSLFSFATSMDNYVPFCLGSRFRTLGINTLAYHNNIGTFYNRTSTHTNMGYEFKAINFGLDVEKGYPSSDLEMMEKSIGDYIENEPFMVHYMTYSGHGTYDFGSNTMSIKNRDRLAEPEDCPEDLQAYYACNLELEDALTYLLEQLEEAGIAERTVIVLTGDHYPYSLKDESYAYMAGEATEEPFWRYRNSFICWKGGMEEPIVVEDYCCTQDILPTILNLFGLPYDSRLLTGTDVFSDSAHIALLQDGSFLTEAMIYNASEGSVTWQKPQEDYPENYADRLIRATGNVFTISAAILRSDYYRFAFESLGLDLQKNEKASSYQDTAGTWYEDEVEFLTGQGVVTGTITGQFSGEEPIQRAAFLAMMTRALNLEPPEEYPQFEDVREKAWYRKVMATAWAAGLLPDEPTCRPEDSLTAEEALGFLTAAAQHAQLPEAEAWAAAEMEGIMAQVAEHSGEELDYLPRGAAAVVTATLLKAIPQE